MQKTYQIVNTPKHLITKHILLLYRKFYTTVSMVTQQHCNMQSNRYRKPRKRTIKYELTRSSAFIIVIVDETRKKETHCCNKS